MAKKKDIFTRKNNISKPVNIPGQEEMISDRVNKANKELGIKNNIVSLNPNEIDTWELRDRADFELGDLKELAISIKNKGQAQPIIVVKKSDIFKPKNNDAVRYIVIAGYRRWRACIENSLDIEVIIKNLTFDQAVECLEAENEKESVSEYSKGIFYSKLKDDYGYTLDKLSKQLGIAISKLSRYLSFAKIPNELWIAVNDVSNVSARTSSELLEIINSDKGSLKFFISIADKIRSGYGHTRLRKLYDENKADDKLVKKPNLLTVSKNSIRLDISSLNLTEAVKKELVNDINIVFKKYNHE